MTGVRIENGAKKWAEFGETIRTERGHTILYIHSGKQH